MTTGIAAEKRTVSEADEVRTFEKGKLELVNIGGGQVGRLTLEPGWRWSLHVIRSFRGQGATQTAPPNSQPKS